jgi:hypothetical protein
MSLVIAFIGRQGAVMAGDTREIITSGDLSSTEILERELYNGEIITDDHLRERAGSLGISITIRDDKRKVTQRDGILVGEVSETQGGITRKKRLYGTTGRYVLAGVTGSDIHVTGTGTAGNFVVLGNQVTKQAARDCIREHWKNGGLQDAVRVIIMAMQRASERSASVSGQYSLIQTPDTVSIDEVIVRDRRQ